MLHQHFQGIHWGCLSEVISVRTREICFDAKVAKNFLLNTLFIWTFYCVIRFNGQSVYGISGFLQGHEKLKQEIFVFMEALEKMPLLLDQNKHVN